MKTYSVDTNKIIFAGMSADSLAGVYKFAKLSGEEASTVAENIATTAQESIKTQKVNVSMKQVMEGKKELFIVNDRDGTPTYTHDFAKTVKTLVQKEYWGLYNCVCGGQTSRLEVAQEFLKIIGKNDDIAINVVTSEYFAEEYFAERPASERLLTKKLEYNSVFLMIS